MTRTDDNTLNTHKVSIGQKKKTYRTLHNSSYKQHFADIANYTFIFQDKQFTINYLHITLKIKGDFNICFTYKKSQDYNLVP